MEDSSYKKSYLYCAAAEGNLDRVKELVEQGVNAEKEHNGVTPLYITSSNGYVEVVRYLAEHGADINKACQGSTPLCAACSKGYMYRSQLEVARYLLEQGADRDTRSPYGWTCLHSAAYHGYLEMAKLLMVYGADLNDRNRNGHLAIDMGNLNTEEIMQATRDEPRRRLDEAPGKRATEEDRHPNTLSVSAKQEEE